MKNLFTGYEIDIVSLAMRQGALFVVYHRAAND